MEKFVTIAFSFEGALVCDKWSFPSLPLVPGPTVVSRAAIARGSFLEIFWEHDSEEPS